jgi:hypothetical protein
MQCKQCVELKEAGIGVDVGQCAYHRVSMKRLSKYLYVKFYITNRPFDREILPQDHLHSS